MTKENILDALNSVDFDMVEDAERVIPKERSKRWIPWAAAVAALAAVFIAVLCIHLPGAVPTEEKMGMNNPPDNVPATMFAGAPITGSDKITLGKVPESSNIVSGMVTGTKVFSGRTILEVELIEVLSDTYILPGEVQKLHVAKFRVLDQLHGDGFPSEVFLQYPNHDQSVFDGFECFFISVDQIGIENYVLINKTQSRVEYFSNMFCVHRGSDLESGDVIAFNGRKVDAAFFNKVGSDGLKWPVEIYCGPGALYPVKDGRSIDDLKKKIVEAYKDDSLKPARDYVTADHLFTTEEARNIRNCVKPDAESIFKQELSFHSIKNCEVVSYQRFIDGFWTDDRIYVSAGGGVSRSDETYTQEEVTRAPHMGGILKELNLEELIPEHIEVTDDMERLYITASGWHRKVDGKVFSVICVVWGYKYPETAGEELSGKYINDDCYLLYDSEGNCAQLDRDELRQVIGDDYQIRDFDYKPYLPVWYIACY